MIRRLALGLLFVLAACNRSGVADVTLDADAAQRNATSAKTLEDLAAATAASRGPPPIVHDAEPVNVQAGTAEARDDELPTVKPAEDENEAALPSNDTAQPDDAAR